MSAPTIVRKNFYGQWIAHCSVPLVGCGTIAHCDTQPVAVAAALAHLRLLHPPEHECCVAHTCCVCATPRTERSHADA